MRKKIVNAFFILVFGVSLFGNSLSNIPPKEEIPTRLSTRAGVSLLTSDIGDMSAYADTVSQNIISTASANPEENADAIVISYKNYYVKEDCVVHADHFAEAEVLYNVVMNDVVYASEPVFTDDAITWSYVAYQDENGEWKVGFIDYNELLEEPIPYTDYNIPAYSGFKSYMDYKAITDVNSPAYKLTRATYTGMEGIRMYDNRYLVAIGRHFDASVGDYVDLILENGTVIKCIVGDRKAWYDTDPSHLFTTNGCMSEFIVNTNSLSWSVIKKGDISESHDEWKSPVTKVRIYKKNAL